MRSNFSVRLNAERGALMLALTVAGCLIQPTVRGANIEWVRQIGNGFGANLSTGVAVDASGGVYISGSTPIGLEGPSLGQRDAFVRKYDATGSTQWTRQFGTANEDSASDIAADKAGSIYVTGNSNITIGGAAYLRKHDEAGAFQWSSIISNGSAEFVVPLGISADSTGSIYVTGYILGSLWNPSAGGEDAFLAKYDAAGTQQWAHQFGVSGDDVGTGVSIDGLGNVYLSGSTHGSLEGPSAGGRDGFLRKYDSSGNVVWAKQFGTAGSESATGVGADALGNVFVSGFTSGSLGAPNAGLNDALVLQYDASGSLVWTRQIGTAADDGFSSASADGTGNVYVAGHSGGSLAAPAAGEEDIIVSKFGADSTLFWTAQLGGVFGERSQAVAADGQTAYTSGWTSSDLAPPGRLPGAPEAIAFVAKVIPEPNAATLALLTAPVLAFRRRAREAGRLA
jgi:hypothetical protein